PPKAANRRRQVVEVGVVEVQRGIDELHSKAHRRSSKDAADCPHQFRRAPVHDECLPDTQYSERDGEKNPEWALWRRGAGGAEAEAGVGANGHTSTPPHQSNAK